MTAEFLPEVLTVDAELNRAKTLLEQLNCTCVLCRGAEVHTSDRRGVAPLLDFLDSGRSYSGFYAADKVVGKATAFLYCLLGVQGVYAQIMSLPASQVLAEQGIFFACDTLVEGIRNRTDTGPCPMETATAGSTDPDTALKAIRETLRRLNP